MYNLTSLDTNSIFDADVAGLFETNVFGSIFLDCLNSPHCVFVLWDIWSTTGGKYLHNFHSFEYTKEYTDDGCLAAGFSMMFSQTDVMFQL